MASGALELRQGQSLVMTQQLRQSIALLQFSTQELNGFIESECESNPLLKREEDGQREMTDMAPQETQDYPDADSAQTDTDFSDKLDIQEGAEWGGTAEEPSAYDGQRYENARDGSFIGQGDHDATSRLSDSKSLHQDVMEQLQCQIFSDIEIKVTEVIVDMIDGSGYLPADIMERSDQLGITESMLSNIISNIQQCEPTGVGARNLQECLSLQLAEKGELSRSMRALLENLALIAGGKEKKLCKLCETDSDGLKALIAQVKACNPKPGNIYDTPIVETLIPEVLVKKNSDGEWVVELNADAQPRVLVDKKYSQTLKEGSRDKEDVKTINEHLANANWLAKALHQRSVTLVTVATEIVRQQQDFFDFGIQYLKPMTLKNIAVEADYHESTISRITTNKFMATSRGVFELKYFFTSTLNNANGGEAYSSRTVMHLIKQMTDEEKSNAVLSDDAIAEALNKQGIDVARRTVVKYRKLMDIPSSIQRRRAKKNSFS